MSTIYEVRSAEERVRDVRDAIRRPEIATLIS